MVAKIARGASRWPGWSWPRSSWCRRSARRSARTLRASGASRPRAELAERRRLIAEQRPHRARSELAPPRPRRAGTSCSAEIEAAILRDARARVRAGRLSCAARRATPTCEPLPGERPGARVSRALVHGGHERGARPGRRRRRDRPSVSRPSWTTGAGRYAWCKVSGRPGEGSYVRRLRCRSALRG